MPPPKEEANCCQICAGMIGLAKSSGIHAGQCWNFKCKCHTKSNPPPKEEAMKQTNEWEEEFKTMYTPNGIPVLIKKFDGNFELQIVGQKEIGLFKDFIHSLLSSERRKAVEEIINELESNPFTDLERSHHWSIQYWIEAKQRQLRAKHLPPNGELRK